MSIVIDQEAGTLSVGDSVHNLYSKEAFELISSLWLKMSWDQKYSYTFTWMGRPIIQHPEDLVRLQEAIYTLQPDVIIETGVAHGGSLILYASLFAAMGKKGKVIGVDIEIRPHNRAAIEAHELYPFITLIEGDSAAPDIIDQVQGEISEGDTVLVLLDSNHTYDHVMKELEAYNHMVSPGSYIVATDGIMEVVHDTPRAGQDWRMNNPARAAREFAARHPQFVIEQPAWCFNESALDKTITTWPDAWLKKVS